MNTKIYGDVTVREEEGNVILTKPTMTRPLIMAEDIFMEIVADHVKEIIGDRDTPGQDNTSIPLPDNTTIPIDNTTK